MSDFSSLIRSYLRSDPADRDLSKGALLLLRIHGNEFRYNAMIRNLQANAQRIEDELNDYLRHRDSIPSKEEARQIRKEAQALIDAKGKRQPDSGSAVAGASELPQVSGRDFKAGKRTDHDSLPEHIQLIFEQNMALKRRMSQYHLEIRNLLKSSKDCASADLKTLVTLLKEADITYRKNWKTYDRYGSQG
ncbi:hypothetical protein HDR70_02100 [bacterium]|nr:hypothetical protein [bacterium]